METAPEIQPEPVSWTSDSRQAYARQLHAAMLAFNNDMAAESGSKSNRLPAGAIERWRTFRDGWARWYSEAGMATWYLDSTVAVIAGYASQLETWKGQFQGWTGRPVSVVQEAPPFNWAPVLILIAIALAGGYWYWSTRMRRLVHTSEGFGEFDFDEARGLGAFALGGTTPAARSRKTREAEHALRAAKKAIRRLGTAAPAELRSELGNQQLLLQREQQFRPTRAVHELGDFALVDDEAPPLTFEDLEVGYEDEPGDDDFDDELDAAYG